MYCNECRRPFTMKNRSSNECGVCRVSTCTTCIKKNFNTSFYSQCRACNKFFFKPPNVYSNQLVNHIYKYLKNLETGTSLLFSFREKALEKVALATNRIKCLNKHLQKFPTDKWYENILAREKHFLALISTISTESELLPCSTCDGFTTVHQLSLEYQARYQVFMMYQSTRVDVLPPSITTPDFTRRCLSCLKEGKHLLSPDNIYVDERRCTKCQFLIQFFQRHNDIYILCCPNCQTLSSRWGHKLPTNEIEANIYNTFFTYSGMLVNQDIRG